MNDYSDNGLQIKIAQNKVILSLKPDLHVQVVPSHVENGRFVDQHTY